MTVFLESLMTGITVGTASTAGAASTAATLAAGAGVGAEALAVSSVAGGAAASAAGTAAVGGTSILSMISGGATTFSALATLGAMNAQGNALEAAAETEKFNAGLAITDGIRRENEISARLLETLGAQNARVGAAGFDLGVGAGSLRKNAIDEAEKQIRIEQRRAKLEAFGRRRRAKALSLDASGARIGGAAQAAGVVAGAADRSLARG